MKHQEFISEDHESCLLQCVELFLEFGEQKEYLRMQQSSEEEQLKYETYYSGVVYTLQSILVNDTLFMSESNIKEIFRSITKYLEKRIKSFSSFYNLHFLLQVLFTQPGSDNNDIESDEGSNDEGSSSHSSKDSG